MIETINKTETGSQLVSALEAVWAEFQKNHDDLPDVVIITGSGFMSSAGKWGHFWQGAWKNGRFVVDGNGEITKDSRGEMFVAGERLGLGAELTVQTMLHEAAHALASVREIKDTSRGGRYHNRKFVDMAELVGLEYAHDKPHGTLGFSDVTITKAARKRYARVIDKLDEAIRLTMELPGWMDLLGGPTTGSGGGNRIGVRRRGKGTKTSLAKATCQCESPRIIRVAPSTLEIAPITCGECESEFQI